jgi:hypothetical protein
MIVRNDIVNGLGLKGQMISFQKEGVDLLSLGTYSIFTTSSLGRFVPLGGVLIPKTYSGVLVVNPAVSVGNNATNYNNMVAALTVATPTVNKFIAFSLPASTTSVDVSSNITYVNVSTAGTVATALTADIIIYGIFE